MKWFFKSIIGLLSWLFSLGVALALIGVGVGFLAFEHYGQDLPDYRQLENYNPPTVTRLYAADGKLLAEYATEKRVFVPLKAIPKRVIQAFLSAEDKNFYVHTGIDMTGIIRAVRDNIINYGQGKSLVGGSTITQQVVKNFLLTNEKSFKRKVREAILALRLSRVYSKDRILELYLNEIYLGLGSYGIAAAAQNYFNKSMDELTIEEMALLAAQPKAPSIYNPHKNYDMAKERRDWVIDRMVDGGYVSPEEAATAKAAPIELKQRDPSQIVQAEFFAEEVRRWLAAHYGADVLYKGGLVVKTTLDPVLQKAADEALQKALISYDRRRGYRGPLFHLPTMDSWKEPLLTLEKEHAYHLLPHQKLAVVTSVSATRANIAFTDAATGTIPFALMKWTRRVIGDGELGPEVTKPADILKIGDVVIAGPLKNEQKPLLTAAEQKKAFDLEQIPEVNGGLTVLDPHTGRVLAMSGGYAYGGTEFNRVTQARRQPGSAFKPFVYMAGLENGFTPSTLILDAPLEMSQGEGQPVWKPQNYKEEYLGPTTMRAGLEKSRNTMTVRLAQMIGIDRVVALGQRFGIYDNDVPRHFSLVLGAAETTLMRLVNAYGMVVNGGKHIVPSLIERIDDRHGSTIYRRDDRNCPKCGYLSVEEADRHRLPPVLEDVREQVADPRVAYQLVSMMEGVVQRGTGARAREVGKIMGGKTGTTNDSRDTWFIGFTPDLVAGVYIGYDQPRTLGARETGSSVALPAFIDFMKAALKDVPNTPFRIPPGIQLVKVDRATGMRPPPDVPFTGQLIDEAFITGEPIFIPGREKKTSDGRRKPPSQADIVVNPPGIDRNPMQVNPPPMLPSSDPLPPPISGPGGLY